MLTNGTEPDAEAEDGTRPRHLAEPAAPAPMVEAAAPSVGGATVDTTTTLAAVGLGSFGAVTSFKTALEKADGVTAVRLSLGSGGEFMYTVTHRADVDLVDVATACPAGRDRPAQRGRRRPHQRRQAPLIDAGR